jgi:PKD repeat protein
MDWENLHYYVIAGIVLALVILAAPVHALAVMHEFLNTDLPGSDYKTFASPAKEDCSNACLNDIPCKAATWVHAVNQEPVCWLKNVVPPKTPYPGDMTRVIHSYIKEDVSVPPLTFSAITPSASQTSCPPFPIILQLFSTCTSCSSIDASMKYPVGFMYTTAGAASVLPTDLTDIVWDFGDGSSEVSHPYKDGIQNKQHTYTVPGDYPVKITASHTCGMKVTVSKPITIIKWEGGFISVDTSPSGGTLFIDNSTMGTLPLSPSPLYAGTHHLRITLAGYNTYSAVITMKSGQNETMSVILQKSAPQSTDTIPSGSPAATGVPTLLATSPDQVHTTTAVPHPPTSTGTIIVSSNPAGANIYLDGVAEGKTPVTIANILAGQHNLLLTLPGYPDTPRIVNVSAGSENQISVDMTGGKKTPGFTAIASVLSVALLAVFRKKLNHWQPQLLFKNPGQVQTKPELLIPHLHTEQDDDQDKGDHIRKDDRH